ncbi:MAG: cytochrome c biogenesis protein ResB [Desulfobia sp.]
MKNNRIVNFFSSVKLALFLIFCLALTSIIGTIIPQNKQAEIYVKEYGKKTADLFQFLDFTNMYSSWWFITLLFLLSLNLIVCSFKRLPNILRIIGKDNLAPDPTRLKKRKEHKIFQSRLSLEEVKNKVIKALNKNGWRPKEKQQDEEVVLFAQKGEWTRFGVYLVHASILIIFIGAMIGKLYGYKGSVMIPETTKKGEIYSFNDEKKIKLDFEILCKEFSLSRYPDGTPKGYVSELAVIENGREVLNRKIEVNDPLHYKGHTFYQASFKPFQKLLATIRDNQENTGTKILIEPGKEAKWEEGGISFGVINRAETKIPGRFKYKVWFYDRSGEPQTFWLTDGENTVVRTEDSNYLFGLKQFYATTLQVTKDPGVWWVYLGFTMIMGGLYIAFFLSHRRLWILIKEDGNTEVIISGNSNKNKAGFNKTFEETAKAIENEL